MLHTLFKGSCLQSRLYKKRRQNFCHILQKCSLIHKVLPALFAVSDKNFALVFAKSLFGGTSVKGECKMGSYYQKVEISGINTTKLPVLKESEKIELIKKAQNGDDEARQQMICGNLRLVLSVVQKFAGRAENIDDLFQVGCIGLIKAIDNFNIAFGLRFSTYGQPMIVGEIRRFLRDNNALRVSRSVRDTAYKAMQARENLQKELGREPSTDEIAQRIEMPVNAVTIAMESIIEPVSLYEPVYSDNNGDTLCLIDQVGQSNSEESWICSIQMRQTVKNLSDRERTIIAMRYLAGKTQVEVANEIGISQAQVSRLEKNAISRIKEEI